MEGVERDNKLQTCFFFLWRNLVNIVLNERQPATVFCFFVFFVRQSYYGVVIELSDNVMRMRQQITDLFFFFVAQFGQQFLNERQQTTGFLFFLWDNHNVVSCMGVGFVREEWEVVMKSNFQVFPV